MKKLINWLMNEGCTVRFVGAAGQDVECVLETDDEHWVSETTIGAKRALEGAISAARFRDLLPAPPWERSIGEELG